MSEPDIIEWRAGYAAFRPSGRMSLPEAVQRVSRAIEAARDRNVRKLLVNVSALTGIESPGLPERYFLVREWAEVAQAMVRVALVLPPHAIDPSKFGTTVAANRGFKIEVFATEEAALEWLLSNEHGQRSESRSE